MSANQVFNFGLSALVSCSLYVFYDDIIASMTNLDEIIQTS
jgi:hypothetical protein